MIEQPEVEGYYPVFITDKHKKTVRTRNFSSKSLVNPIMEVDGRQRETALKETNANEASSKLAMYKTYNDFLSIISYVLLTISAFWNLCDVIGHSTLFYLKYLPYSKIDLIA